MSPPAQATAAVPDSTMFRACMYRAAASGDGVEIR